MTLWPGLPTAGLKRIGFWMNFSRIYTCLYGRKLSNFLKENKTSVIAIGRVMTCVLGLVVDRSRR